MDRPGPRVDARARHYEMCELVEAVDVVEHDGLQEVGGAVVLVHRLLERLEELGAALPL